MLLSRVIGFYFFLTVLFRAIVDLSRDVKVNNLTSLPVGIFDGLEALDTL